MPCQGIYTPIVEILRYIFRFRSRHTFLRQGEASRISFPPVSPANPTWAFQAYVSPTNTSFPHAMCGYAQSSQPQISKESLSHRSDRRPANPCNCVKCNLLPAYHTIPTGGCPLFLRLVLRLAVSKYCHSQLHSTNSCYFLRQAFAISLTKPHFRELNK